MRIFPDSPDPLQEVPLLTEMSSGAASPARPLLENSQGLLVSLWTPVIQRGPVAAGRG